MTRHYKFMGYDIHCCGYHQPDHCVWWEAVDKDGEACFHGKTLREVEFLIVESKKDDEYAVIRDENATLKKSLDEVSEEYHKLKLCYATAMNALKQVLDYDEPWTMGQAERASRRLIAINEAKRIYNLEANNGND